jgi:hypothetical protein
MGADGGRERSMHATMPVAYVRFAQQTDLQAFLPELARAKIDLENAETNPADR